MSKFANLFAAQDLTTGTPWKKILSFAAPLLIGNIAQQMYNTADSIIVGKYVGDNALAAVGSSGPVINLLIVLLVGISTGAGIMVAQYYGARRKEDLANAVGTCMGLTLIASLFLMAMGGIIIEPMLTLLDTPAEIFDMCRSYLQICFYGAAGMAYYNILAGILRGMGDSVSALIYLICAACINIVGDIILIGYFDMGVAGAALATIASQFLSAMLSARKLFSMRDAMHLRKDHLKIKKSYAMQLIKLGLPSGLAQAVMSCSALVVQSLSNSFGAAFVACNTIVMRVDGFVMMPNFSFGNAMTTYTGQNIGARRIDRVEEGIKEGLKLALGTAAIMVAAILLFGRILMGFFTDTPELIDMSKRMMTIVAPGYIAFAATQCLSGTMRGAGDTTTPMWISFFTTIVVRVPMAYAIAYLTRSADFPNGRPESLFISLLCSWVIGAAINVIAFRRGKWRKKAQLKFSDEE